MSNIEEIKQDIYKNPNEPSLYYRLGKEYIRKNRLDEAISALRKSVELTPHKTRHRLLLAKCYVRNHDHMRARGQYNKVLLSDPSNIGAYKNLALIYEFHLGDPQRALAHYQKYIDLGGDSERIIKRFNLLREETQAAASDPNHPGTDYALEERRRSRTARMHTVADRVLGWRDKVAKKIAQNQAIIMNTLYAIAIFAVLMLCSDTFPVADDSLTLLMCIGIGVLTIRDPKFGATTAAVVMFFPIAFYSIAMGCLYAVGVLALFLIYRNDGTGRIILFLLTPLLLKANLAHAVVLGAPTWLKSSKTRNLGVMFSFVSICYMIATNTHQLGPFSSNHTGIPILVTSYESIDIGDFFMLKWMGPFFSAKLIVHLLKLGRSVYPAMLNPPTALVHIATWGLAGYAAGRMYQKRSFFNLASVMGITAAIFMLEALIVENLLRDPYFSSSAAVQGFGLSSILIAAIVFLKIGSFDEEVPVEAIKEPALTTEDLEDISWDSIGGLEDVKEEIRMVIRYQFERGFSRFSRRFGLKGIKGILFYGPPGCGKTLFAKVLAKDVNASFFPVKGSDFRSKWYGESEQNLSLIFEKARQNTPAIIFFDEIDSMLERRDSASSQSAEKDIVAQFLTELDGVKPLRGAIVVGATNEPDSIDPAAIRPGRFDKLIYIPLPDSKGRETIFRVHLRNKPVTGGIELGKLVALTERFSGADIADVCTKVAEQAMRESLQLGQTVAITGAALERQIHLTKPSVSIEMLRKYEELREKYERRTIKSETEPATEKKKYSWKQVGGLIDVRKELIEAIETPLKKTELYSKYKISPPKGVLLFGPPGCGKTLLAKIVSSQCEAHFLLVDIKKETGESIRKWFIRAKENRPSVLFFDEIDSIAESRDMAITVSQGVVQQLLVEMDGVEDLKQVVVMAATNRPDRLDNALMRPGRFDRMIYIPPPDEEARREILGIHLKGKPLADDVNLDMIIAETKNYSGADLSALCYEASMCLIRRSDDKKPMIMMEDFRSALAKVRSSITDQELEYFEEIKAAYSRG